MKNVFNKIVLILIISYSVYWGTINRFVHPEYTETQLALQFFTAGYYTIEDKGIK